MAVGYTEGYKIGKERGWILGYQKGVRLAAEVAQDVNIHFYTVLSIAVSTSFLSFFLSLQVGFYEGYREVSIQLGSASDARFRKKREGG